MTNTPKILRDMTDAEIGALVRAEWDRKQIYYYGLYKKWLRKPENYQWFPDDAYRITPPAHLPLEVGKVYRTAAGDWTCKFIDRNRAYCTCHANSTAAYGWNVHTGKTESMSDDRYDITGLSENQEAGQ